jgi:outer membrane protein
VTAHAIVAAMLLAAPARVVTLEEALESARAHLPQLRQARAVTQAAEARARSAKSSLLPQLSASAGYVRTTANFTARPGTVPGSAGTMRSSTFDNSNYFNDSVTLNQLLYDFGQATGRYDAAQAQAQAQADSERAVGLLAELSVRSAFFDARANKSLVEVARQALTNQEAHLGQIESFVQVGTRPDIDLAQARSDAANARVQLISAENTYDISRATLNQAMGVEGPLDYDVADQALAPVAGEGLPIDPLLDEAIKARPEIASLMKQVRALQLTMRSIEGAYGPTLGAQVGFTQGGIAVDHLTWNMSAGLTLTWQLYQGGLTSAQVREAQANVAQVAAQLDLVRAQLRVEVEQARLSVRAAQASLGAAKDALLSAQERLRLAEGRYETGIGSIIELGDAQVALTSAAVQAVQADLKLSAARAQLLKALGRS